MAQGLTPGGRAGSTGRDFAAPSPGPRPDARITHADAIGLASDPIAAATRTAGRAANTHPAASAGLCFAFALRVITLGFCSTRQVRP